MHLSKLAQLATAFALILGACQAARAQAAPAQDTAGLDNATCLGCHAQSVSSDHFAGSVHGSLACTACHTTITAVPHTNPPRTPEQWRREIPTLCGTCHAAALND